MEPTKVLLTQDGKVKAVCPTHNDAWMRLLKIQPHSTLYAQKYGGWKMVPMFAETDVVFTRDVMRSEIFPPD
jgi:hypothetical protein